MAVGISACGKKSTADISKQFTEGVSLITDATGIDMSVETKMTQSYEGQSGETTYNSTLQKQNKDGVKYLASITVGMQGQSFTSQYAIDGDKAYFIQQEQYSEIDATQAEQYATFNKVYSNFEADAVTNMSTSKEDKKTVYKMELDPSKASDLINAHLEGYMMSTEQMDVEIHNAAVSVVFSGKNISEITYEYSLAATQKATESGSTEGSAPIELTVSSHYTVNSIGESVSFELPDISTLTPAQSDTSGTEE